MEDKKDIIDKITQILNEFSKTDVEAIYKAILKLQGE